MAISKEAVQTIRDRLSIVDVISRRVTLQERGKRFVGLCPFHGEKTPSFSVSPDKGLYYCFGCHASGDIFTFVRETEGLDFPEAVRRLAHEVGVELEPESPEVRAKRKKLRNIARANEYAQAFFTSELLRSPGNEARRYLNTRGIPDPQWRKRGLGYGGRPGELLAYLEGKRVPTTLVTEAGLVTDGGRSLFERRLTFPIRDLHGQIAGFGGRRLAEGSTPKYVNTREGPCFSKRHLLYGWEFAREAARRKKRVVVVEGYTDVLAFARHDIEETVASLGTAITDEHGRLLKRFVDEVVLVLDGDAAGYRASREAAQKLLRVGLKVSVVQLPAGQDPDVFVRAATPEQTRRIVEARRAAVEVFVEQSFASRDHSIEARSDAVAELAPLFLAMPRGLKRDLYEVRLAERVGVPIEQLRAHLRRSAPRQLQRSSREQKSRVSPSTGADRARPLASKTERWPRREVSMLRELLLYPELRGRLAELAEYAPSRLATALTTLTERLEAPIDSVIPAVVDDPRARMQLIEVSPYEGEDHEERGERTFRDVRASLQSSYLDAMRLEVIQALDDARTRGEDTAELEQQIIDLTRMARRLKRAGQHSGEYRPDVVAAFKGTSAIDWRRRIHGDEENG